jgi:replicative DNA helicase
MDSESTERALIGLVLSEPAEFAPYCISEGLRADWFVGDPWRLLWHTVEQIWARGQLADADAFSIYSEAQKISAAARDGDKLKSAYIETVDKIEDALKNAATSALLHVDALRNAWTKRAAVSAWNKHASTFDGAANAGDVIVGLKGSLDKILEGRETDSKKISAAPYLDEISEEYKTAYQRRIVEKDLSWTPGYRMPWEHLTTLLGGLRPGLHIVAARPSVGKTSYALNLLRYWLDLGLNVCFNSLDMPHREMIRRLLAERSRVSYRKAAYSPTKVDLRAMADAANVIKKLPLDFCAIRDIDSFRNHVMLRKSQGLADIVMVDYLGLMSARSLGKENAVEYARVSYVSDQLKELANRLDVPVIALCQLNRAVAKAGDNGEGREPDLADLRGSGSIEQDAFTITFLHRDYKVWDKWQTEGNKPLQLVPGRNEYGVRALDPIWWILAKSQNGDKGKFPFVVRKPYFCWSLADVDAKGIATSQGYGATAKTVIDNSPFFARVYADWRGDAIEAVLREQGALIDSGVKKQNAPVNTAFDFDDEDSEF